MHKQKYFKRENKKVNKDHLQEITGNRNELEPLLGETLECEVFVTNSLGYLGDKRLLTEIRIPESNWFIKHLWVKEYNLPLDKVQHGYRKVKLKVISYKDQKSDDVKYGVKIADEKLKPKAKEAKMVIPKWKLDQLENEKLIKRKPETKLPFKKIKIVRKAR